VIIDSLFQHTQPTALIIGDAVLFHAVQVHLAYKGILAPQHVSLFCNDYEQSFKWALPNIAHIQWDHRPSIRRVMQWAKNIGHGKNDRKKSITRAVLHEGDTIGSAPLA
jgi:DNA-binding LacI/PurR family transcriptional regulator